MKKVVVLICALSSGFSCFGSEIKEQKDAALTSQQIKAVEDRIATHLIKKDKPASCCSACNTIFWTLGGAVLLMLGLEMSEAIPYKKNKQELLDKVEYYNPEPSEGDSCYLYNVLNNDELQRSSCVSNSTDLGSVGESIKNSQTGLLTLLSLVECDDDTMTRRCEGTENSLNGLRQKELQNNKAKKDSGASKKSSRTQFKQTFNSGR